MEGTRAASVNYIFKRGGKPYVDLFAKMIFIYLLILTYIWSIFEVGADAYN